jgi:hypothetical protein
LTTVASALLLAAVFTIAANAQGGWRQWDIHLRDGNTLEANPLGMKAGRFTRSMSDKEVGLEREKIAYVAAVRRELPPLPVGKFKKDVIVMLDGTQMTGTVKFKEIKFSEGTIVQNGKEMTLENVAYIFFAAPRKRLGY